MPRKKPSRKRTGRSRRAGGTKGRRLLEQPASDKVAPFGNPIVRLTDQGIDWGVWPGPGDEVGYGMDPHRGDDCFSAAIATCTQVPIERVPDFGLLRRFHAGEDPDQISRSGWGRLLDWANTRNLAIAFSDEVPLPADRWIGVISWAKVIRESGALTRLGLDPDDIDANLWRELHAQTHLSPFQDHCLVMTRDRVLFDPSCSVQVPRGATAHFVFDPDHVSYGLTFTRKET